jgi:hypothetical protein
MIYVVLGLYIIPCVDTGVKRYGLPPSVGFNGVGFYMKTEINLVCEMLYFKKETGDE